MSTRKSLPENQQVEVQEKETSVFPEGHVMNEWSYDRNIEFINDRSRDNQYMESNNESVFHIPREWWPEGFQVIWASEYVMGEPQPDNLRRLRMKGYEFVHQDEIPQLPVISLQHHFDRNVNDQWIRKLSHILMKKPMDAYLKDQHDKQQKGIQIQHESESLTNYLGGGTTPRFVVENSSKYQPNHVMKRG